MNAVLIVIGLAAGLALIVAFKLIVWAFAYVKASDDPQSERAHGDCWPYVPQVFPTHVAEDSE